MNLRVFVIAECAECFFSALMEAECGKLTRNAEKQVGKEDDIFSTAQELSVSKEQMKSFTLIPFMPSLGLDSSMTMSQTQLPQTGDSAGLVKAQV